jgi:EmrB/QacA subfamily drug resistance transporter
MSAAATVETERGWGVPLLVLISGMFMSILDTSIVNVAVKTIEGTFGATTDEVAWVVTAYALALGVVVPLSAWLAARFGAARVYSVALVLFGLSSALCGLAWSLDSLIAFRILQAIPGGLLPALSMAILYRIVPPDKIGQAMGMLGLGIIVAPATGPTLGGYIVEYLDWRLIFFINVPIGIAATIAAIALLPKLPPEGKPKFDAIGFATIATGLFSLLLALSEGDSWGWTSFRVVALLCLAAVMLAVFIVWELETDEPLLNVRVFRTWAYTNSLLIISVVFIGLFAILFYIPLYLQAVQGLGALKAGVTLLPQALIMAIVMPLAGQIYDRVGPRIPAVIGMAVCAYGSYLLHDITVDTSRGDIAMILTVRSAGMGLAMVPVMTGGLASLRPDVVPSGAAFNNVVEPAAEALGLAVLGSLLTAMQAQLFADRSALIPGGVDTPSMGGGESGHLLGLYATYEHTNAQVFVDGLSNLLLIVTVVTLIGFAVALFQPTGRPDPSAAPPMH